MLLLENVEPELELRETLHHISSSLLLNRLTLLRVGGREIGEAVRLDALGTLPIGTRVLGIYHFARRMDSVSTLTLYDYKVQARVLFSGSEEAQYDAVELINLLTSFSFRHAYDGIMAGTVA